MFRFRASENSRQLADTFRAIGRSQAMIEFDPDGTVRTANENFLALMGYTLSEVRGRHHGMFVEPGERDGQDYRDFWASLRQGEFSVRLFKRIAKGGREVWIQASYNPVSDAAGRVYRIVKIATDVTDRVRRDADAAGKVAAIAKSQAVIEFGLDGTILTANDVFLQAVGYALEEVVGRHHRMFVDAAERDSGTYARFWERLARGEHQTGEFRRLGRDGREVWIQASYNPILDLDGRPFKVVKFATDVTQQKLRSADHAGQMEAIGKSQAVIEFAPDGTILTANENFLRAVGYRLDEIRGRHHSLFVEPSERETPAYAAFWEKLRRGEYQAGEYRRLGKDGREVWIQASYNPILGLDGKPAKVVKFASDVTAQALARMRAEHVGRLMETVAAGSEQLTASVKEIAGSMALSKDRTSDAFEMVMAADRATQQLTAAAQSMGGILDVISNITGQINLLALNATIESARAGAAGRGFAVVANEVKTLAGQARTAAEQVAREIDGMRAVSGEVVGSLDAIRGAMREVLDYVTSTASAVEEQTAVAGDMSANMQRAAAEASRMGEAA